MASLDDALRDKLGINALEKIEGFVEEIRDDVAYLRLTDESGKVWDGVYSAEKLANNGIYEGRRFYVYVKKGKEGPYLDIGPIPDIELSDEMIAEIRKRVEEITGMAVGEE